MDAELLPPLKQTLWGRLAVANFLLGGAGAGLYVVVLALSRFSVGPVVRSAMILAALLVLAGFLCVAVEAGRPLRGPRVLRMARTSWMSRESWVGGAFVALAAVDLVRPWLGWRLAAALAALIFALAQGWVLRNCRGVAAWNVPLLPPVFLASSLVSGAGVLGLAAPVGGLGAERLAVGTIGLILLSGLAWGVYLTVPRGSAFREGTAVLRQDMAILGIFVVGHVVPLVVLVVGLRSPQYFFAAAFLAGAGILIGQLQAKAWLILRAGLLRPITISNLSLHPAPDPRLGGAQVEMRK